jgi:hypothetical protein
LPSPTAAANTKGGFAPSAYDRNQRQNPTLQTAGSRDTIKPFGCASGLVPEVPLKARNGGFGLFLFFRKTTLNAE